MKHGLKITTGLFAAILVMSAATAEARQGVIRARGTNGAVTAKTASPAPTRSVTCEARAGASTKPLSEV